MLGLGKQVHRHPIRVSAAITNDQNFRWAGHHIDAHSTKHLTLGGRHINISRPDNFINSRHGVRSTGHSRYRLSAPDRKQSIHSGYTGRSQHQIIYRSTGRRHHHYDFGHTCHFGRHGIHKHRRGVTRLTTGNINANPLKGGNLLPQKIA